MDASCQLDAPAVLFYPKPRTVHCMSFPVFMPANKSDIPRDKQRRLNYNY